MIPKLFFDFETKKYLLILLQFDLILNCSDRILWRPTVDYFRTFPLENTAAREIQSLIAAHKGVAF